MEMGEGGGGGLMLGMNEKLWNSEKYFCRNFYLKSGKKCYVHSTKFCVYKNYVRPAHCNQRGNFGHGIIELVLKKSWIFFYY